MPHVLDWVAALAPYQPGKPIEELAREFSLDPATIIKLASNENPLGMSTSVREAIAHAATGAYRYPDGHGYDLKNALAYRFVGIRPDQLVLGNGSNDVLDLAARALLYEGAHAVYSQYAFLVYPLVVQATGAQGIVVPSAHYGHNLPAMQDALTAETKIVFIANPNNPTGTWLTPKAVKSFLEKLPKDVLLILDEAYDDYLPEQDRSPSFDWLKEHNNLLITRTFSKIYGLAGLRVGYGVTNSALADKLNRVRQPFNVSGLAQSAACAALADEAFVRESFAVNLLGLRQMEEGFLALNLPYIPSRANFITVELKNSTEVYQRLLSRGIIVRPLANYGMPQHLRITIGTKEENSQVLAAIKEICNA